MIIRQPRRGFTMMEMALALFLLALAGSLVAEMTTWALGERGRSEARLVAMEWACNVLEQARAEPWDKLTPEWAAQQTLPNEVAQRLLEPTFAIRVEPVPEQPQLKRVTVNLRWQQSHAAAAPPVVMTTTFAARSRPEAP